MSKEEEAARAFSELNDAQDALDALIAHLGLEERHKAQILAAKRRRDEALNKYKEMKGWS
jgi:hypothetical protein